MHYALLAAALFLALLEMRGLWASRSRTFQLNCLRHGVAAGASDCASHIGCSGCTSGCGSGDGDSGGRGGD